MSNDDYNDLFPGAEPEQPDDDGLPEEEHMREIAEMLEEMSIEETCDGIETEMRDIAGKFAFEMLITLLNPTPESRSKIISGLVTMAAKKVESDVNKQAGDMEDDEAFALGEHVNAAFTSAEKRFREDYENAYFDPEFMERCRKAIRKNLSR